MSMNLSTILALVGAAATLTNLLNAWLTNRVRVEITQLKLETAAQREKDRDWMAERYITRTELDAEILRLEARLR